MDEVRLMLERARQAVAEGNSEEVASDLDEALAMLDDDPLLTPKQAADLIGIELELIVLGWCHQGKLRCTGEGRDRLVPRSEAAWIRDSAEAERIRRSDAVHDATAMLGLDRPMTQEEMDALSESRRGLTLPWNVAKRPDVG